MPSSWRRRRRDRQHRQLHRRHADLRNGHGRTTGTNSLVVTAENASGRSRAALAYAYAATDGYRAEEDAQLIADLTGDGTAAPVVYTVAGDVAASVNRLHGQRQVPFGLFAAEEAQTLLTFTGVSLCATRASTMPSQARRPPLAEGYTLTLAGASHGRYFLRSDGSTATGIGDEQAGDEGTADGLLRPSRRSHCVGRRAFADCASLLGGRVAA